MDDTFGNRRTFDAEKQREILKPFWKQAGPDCRTPPKSAGELVANFSKEERLALYEYTLKHAASVAKPPELLSPEEVLHSHNPTSGDLTPLELKKAMRDFKRRRQAYRTKVSTKNKSQVQVTREIIHNMMVFLGTEEIEHKTGSGTQPSHSDRKRKPSSSPRDDTGSEASVLMDSKKIKTEDSSHCEHYKSSEKLSKEDKKRYNRDKYYVHKKNTSFDYSSKSSNRKRDAKVIPDNISRIQDDVRELQSKRKGKNFEKAKYRQSSSDSASAENERNGSTRHSKKRKLKKSKRKKSKSKKSHKYEYSTSEDT
ncbi:U11/U12 small nuclear ribonucleoprotein 48 kDa protein-like isoform X2 [Macrobrachium nipponense]|uniref:U11/U12 small nuclear ribonucleoprotein 48 kDa protein-like isoform X2 n=1 Tax=Macrobrachium nipponense TaxID=159736 RepID=UPI0030C8512E